MFLKMLHFSSLSVHHDILTGYSLTNKQNKGFIIERVFLANFILFTHYFCSFVMRQLLYKIHGLLQLPQQSHIHVKWTPDRPNIITRFFPEGALENKSLN